MLGTFGHPYSVSLKQMISTTTPSLVETSFFTEAASCAHPLSVNFSETPSYSIRRVVDSESPMSIPDYDLTQTGLISTIFEPRKCRGGYQIDSLVRAGESGLIVLCEREPERAAKLQIAVRDLGNGWYLTTCPDADSFNFLASGLRIVGDLDAPYFGLQPVYGGIDSMEASTINGVGLIPHAVWNSGPFASHDRDVHIAGMCNTPYEVAKVLDERAESLLQLGIIIHLTDQSEVWRLAIDTLRSANALALDVITGALSYKPSGNVVRARNELLEEVSKLLDPIEFKWLDSVAATSPEIDQERVRSIRWNLSAVISDEEVRETLRRFDSLQSTL